jgi:hypothetical protein
LLEEGKKRMKAIGKVSISAGGVSGGFENRLTAIEN